MLRLFAPSIPFFTMLFIARGVGNGSGSTRIPSLLDISRLWGLRIPLAIVLSSTMGVDGIWIAMVINNLGPVVKLFAFATGDLFTTHHHCHTYALQQNHPNC